MRKYVIIALGAVALGFVLYLAVHRNAYGRHKAGPDSADVQQALKMLRSIASSPETVKDYVSSEAKKTARRSLVAAAEAMAKARSVDLKDSEWFGNYLRVGVTCPRTGGGAYEPHFFLKKENGQLRLTGLDA